MSYKFEIIEKDKLVVRDTTIVDATDSIILDMPLSDAYYGVSDLKKDIVFIYDKNSVNASASGVLTRPLGQCIDSNDVPFTKDSFRLWANSTLGFDDASVGVEYVEYQIGLTPEVVPLNNDGVTYVKVPNMVSGLMSGGFTVSGGTLTKVDTLGTFLINGVSDLEANKAIEITFALFLNGALVPSELTSHTFSNQAKIENISITTIANLNIGDTVEIFAKSDGTTNSIITVNKLDVTFVQIK